MSGWLTNGLTTLTPATYQSGSTPREAIDTNAPGGVSPQTAALPTGAVGMGDFSTLLPAGASVGTAVPVVGFKSVIFTSLTASTKGVKLPTAVTGLSVLIINGATFGVKVYANAAGQSIGAGTTNTTAVVLAINKATVYFAVSATKWIVLAGA